MRNKNLVQATKSPERAALAFFIRRIWRAASAAQEQRGYLLHARSFTAWRRFRMTPG